MMRQLLLALSCLFALTLSGQEIKINNGLEGYWSGALIRSGNSAQSITVEFYMEQDTLRAASNIPDWAYYPPQVSVVNQEGRVVKFDTYYGEVTLVQDSAYAEMVGECRFAQVHLKKGLRPPRRKLEKQDLVFDFGDIQSSPEALDALWVRRNRYDPPESLKAFKGPFLSILGGSDFVVPYRENSARFQRLFNEVGKTNYRISILPSASHGMEHGHAARDLGFEENIGRWNTYFKFDRVAPGALDEIVAFLSDYGVIE